MEARKVKVERIKLRLQDFVYILARFRGVGKTARVVHPWGLLTGWHRPGRRGVLGNGAVDLIPDQGVVWILGKGGAQEGLNAAEVEVVRGGSGNKFQEVALKVLATTAGKQKRCIVGLQCYKEDKGKSLVIFSVKSVQRVRSVW